MGSTWLCIPSKRPIYEAGQVFAKWREMGYSVCIQVDEDSSVMAAEGFLVVRRKYQGYAEAVNYLSRAVLSWDPSCDWIVAAGDDTLPDPNKRAEQIAEELTAHFSLNELGFKCPWKSGTFGVCQPTGDPWSDRRGRIIERIAGSPWLGREWCLRANQGKGPLWPGFFHCWADECLQLVAQQLGVFWQRPDICHHHANWGRPKEGERLGHAANMPQFLAHAYSEKVTTADKKEFDRLKADGWKECLPL